MGYALVREILSARPAGPGPEWWLLLDLADDADDRTRRTMCGLDYMMARAQAPRSTVLRWLKKLRDDGLVVTVEKAAGGASGQKGKRAVYEIQVPARLTERIAAHLSQVSPGGTRVGESGPTGADQTPSRVGSHPVRPDPAGNGSLVSPAVRPPLQDPLRAAPVEGARAGSGQERSLDSEELKIVAPEREARRAGGSGGAGAPPGPQPLTEGQLPPAA